MEEIFGRHGHASLVASLQRNFETHKRLGRGLDLTSYTARDATAVLFRYLKSLPEPLIPYSWYESMTDPIRHFPNEQDPAQDALIESTVRKLQRAITSLPNLHLHLLLCIHPRLAGSLRRQVKFEQDDYQADC